MNMQLWHDSIFQFIDKLAPASAWNSTANTVLCSCFIHRTFCLEANYLQKLLYSFQIRLILRPLYHPIVTTKWVLPKKFNAQRWVQMLRFRWTSGWNGYIFFMLDSQRYFKVEQSRSSWKKEEGCNQGESGIEAILEKSGLE